MPFLLVTGHPSSGKSTVVNRLVEYLTSEDKNVIVVRDTDNATFNKSWYSDSIKEKDHRSYIRSLVQKNLNKTSVVICDSLNYIKGFRYELFLTGKLAKTTFAVLHCVATEETCQWLNSQADASDRYDEQIVSQLIQRYEKPDPKNRWDSPLFELNIGHAEKVLDDSEKDDLFVDLEYPSPRSVPVPFEEIKAWLFEGVALTENKSTAVVPLAPTNYLHELDRATQEVVSCIIQGQRDMVLGSPITISMAENGSNQVQYTKVRSLPELTRLRRQFISFSKSHNIETSAKIASLFINFLNTTNFQ